MLLVQCLLCNEYFYFSGKYHKQDPSKPTHALGVIRYPICEHEECRDIASAFNRFSWNEVVEFNSPIAHFYFSEIQETIGATGFIYGRTKR